MTHEFDSQDDCLTRLYKVDAYTESGKENYIRPKVTKMGTIISRTIDYNGVGILKGQQHIPSKNILVPRTVVSPTSKAREKLLGDEVAATIDLSSSPSPRGQ